MSTTNYLGLNIPDKNSKGRVVTDVFDPNFTKLDQNAEVVDRDKNAIWGGLDGGGLIEDPSVTKVVGKRYIGADGKAYICLVPSNINNSTNYAPCNVVDNLDKLQNLFNKYLVLSNPLGYLTFDIRALNYNKLLVITGYINISNNSGLIKAGVIGKFSGIFMGQQKYITIDAVGINGVIKNVGFLQGDEIVLNQNLESGTYGGAVYIRSSGVII